MGLELYYGEGRVKNILQTLWIYLDPRIIWTSVSICRRIPIIIVTIYITFIEELHPPRG